MINKINTININNYLKQKANKLIKKYKSSFYNQK